MERLPLLTCFFSLPNVSVVQLWSPKLTATSFKAESFSQRLWGSSRGRVWPQRARL